MEPPWGNFGTLRLHFELTLTEVGRIWRQVGPKMAQVGFKCVQVTPKMTSNWTFGVTLWHFGSTLGLLWVILGSLWSTLGTLGNRFRDTLVDFGATLNSLCGHEGYIGIIFARFQKTFIFHIDFNDFMEPRCQLGAFALAFSLAFALAFALKLRSHLHLHLQWHLNLHFHGQIRFWTAPCAKVIRIAEPNSCRADPRPTANHRESQPRISKRYQITNSFD